MSSLKSFKLSQLAEILGAELEGDPSKEIIGINTLETSSEQDISFIARESYLTQLSTTKAGAVICSTEYSEFFRGNKLICENPYLTYARCTELFKEKPSIKTDKNQLFTKLCLSPNFLNFIFSAFKENIVWFTSNITRSISLGFVFFFFITSAF